MQPESVLSFTGGRLFAFLEGWWSHCGRRPELGPVRAGAEGWRSGGAELVEGFAESLDAVAW